MLKFSAKMAILYLTLITQQEIRPLDHVPKQKPHSVERGKLISFFSLRSFDLSKMYILQCYEWRLIDGKLIYNGQPQIHIILAWIVRAIDEVLKQAKKCLEQQQAQIHNYFNVDSASNHLRSQKNKKCLGTSTFFFSVLAYCLHKTLRFIVFS